MKALKNSGFEKAGEPFLSWQEGSSGGGSLLGPAEQNVCFVASEQSPEDNKALWVPPDLRDTEGIYNRTQGKPFKATQEP